MDLATFTLDHLKTLYNTALADARNDAQNAQTYREEIERRDAAYRGTSRRRLTEAVQALYNARTFANTPHDLPAHENTVRTT